MSSATKCHPWPQSTTVLQANANRAQLKIKKRWFFFMRMMFACCLLAANAGFAASDNQATTDGRLPVSLMWATPLLDMDISQQSLDLAYKAVLTDALEWQDETQQPEQHPVLLHEWTATLRDCALDMFEAFQENMQEHGGLSSNAASPQHANEVCMRVQAQCGRQLHRRFMSLCAQSLVLAVRKPLGPDYHPVLTCRHSSGGSVHPVL